VAIHDWCVWKALDEACPAVASIVADFLVVVCLWLGFVAFHLLAHLLVPSDLLAVTEEAHKLAAFASFAGITALGCIRLMRAYWP